jgi:hypothetical protein
MIIEDTVLIQVYATVLAGILIFMTVQRLFEWKERFEEKSSKLLQLRGNAITERETHQEVVFEAPSSMISSMRIDSIYA